ncbi:ABC transporter substrate-binding protein [Rhodococcus sp. ACPA4]|uniref:ABC transporter substrate-binding protein n=1 Tax=Rhodococcus sp. ACPA4 TaxID=2028571 RepID=UPI0015C7E2E9|nr:ABC transporter substrate-binding protein [Rhodococcus sp. ACPA4]
MRKKLRIVAVAAVVGSLLLSSCGSSSGSGDDGTIRIASIAPMSGAASVYGKSVTAAMQYAVDEKNNAGGVEVNGTKHKIDLTLFDDEQKPDVAQSVARKALDEGYNFVFGPFGSGTASASQSLMAQSEAYFQLTVAAVEGPTKNPNVFRSGARINLYTDIALDYLKNHPEIKTVGMITDQLHTGLVSEEPRLVAGIEALGRTVVLQDKMQLGDTDFRAPLTKMLSVKPDIYLVRAYPAETVLITKQAKELGGNVPLQWSAGMTNGEVKTLVNDEAAMVNVTQATPLANLDPFLAAKDPLAETVAAGLGDKAGTFAVAAYDGMQVFFAGLESADEVSPQALQTAMSGLQTDEIKDITIQDFRPQDSGQVFKDREVLLNAAAVRWQAGVGFVIAD